jgi:hypothetical protein
MTGLIVLLAVPSWHRQQLGAYLAGLAGRRGRLYRQ